MEDITTFINTLTFGPFISSLKFQIWVKMSPLEQDSEDI